jgi:hypothetical protein
MPPDELPSGTLGSTFPHDQRTEDSLKKLLILTGTTLGSAVGWWLGADFGIMTAFIVSMIGFGVGMWGGARLAKHLGE